MKLALTIAILIALAGTAHAAGTAYYKPDQAATDSAEGKKNIADEKADLEAKKAQLQRAENDATSAEKAKAKDAAAKRQQANALGQQLQQQLQQLQQTHAQHLSERIARVAAGIRKARKLDALVAVYPGSDVDPKADLTAEVVKRLDAGEGTSDEEALADLRRKAADRDAQKARADAFEKELAEARKAPAPVPAPPTAASPPSKPVAKR